MKYIKKGIPIIIFLFLLAQFFQPEKNNGELVSINPFLEETQPSETVQLILKNSCFDCHSNHTNYPWYANITPINYFIAHHVNEGKKEFNMSQWEGTSVKRKIHKMEEVAEVVQEKTMPLNLYIVLHSEANLTDLQREAVVNWAENVQIKYQLQPKPE